ncbi:MAG: HAMP domain-containing protein, partial [Lachnospiraceae bacterium]|nr:HAMP domain-containing protein [Lachnospiraceae bacterium]
MKRSIRRQLLVTFVGIMVVSLLAIALINLLFLGRFYESRKVKEIEKAYNTINGLDSLAEEDFNEAIMEIAIQDNLQILITDEDFTTVRSTSRDARDLAARLFGYYTGFYRDTITVVRESDYYTIQKTKDIAINTSYLEMWGQLDNAKWFLIRTPIESIENAVRLSNFFYLCIGALVTTIAVAGIIMLSKRITNPIVQLSDLSKKMAELDFDARYTGHAGNEIDQLGENFNKMSDTLEQTIAELKTANVELQKDVERKNQIDEVRKEFLNNVSHELKTPIALISGYAEGLKENIAEDPESREFYCDVIIDEANKMNVMVKKLLTLNQLEFGNDQTVMERFDLTAL